MSQLPLGPGATRAGTDAAIRSALIRPGFVMLAPDTSPANGTQAARELLGERATFSHLANGYPVYTCEATS